MKKQVTIALVAAFFLTAVVSPVAGSYTANSTNFSYGVSSGVELTYHASMGLDAQIDDASLFAGLDSMLLSEMGLDLDSEDIFNALLSYLSMNLDVKMGISSLNKWDDTLTMQNGDWWNGYVFPEGGTVTWARDEINGSIQMNNGSAWVNPDHALMDKAAGFIQSAYTDGYINASVKDQFLSMVAGMPLSPSTSFANEKITGNNLPTTYMNTNGTPASTMYGDEGEGAPVENPFPQWGGSDGVPLIMPDFMDFSKYKDALDAAVAVMIAGEMFPFESLDAALAVVGLTTFQITPRSIAIVLDLDEIDLDTIGTLMESMMPTAGAPASASGLTDMLSGYGLDAFSGKVSLSLEYNKAWILSSAAVFMDGSFTVNTTDRGYPIPMDIDGDVDLGLNMTLVLDGVTAPTAEDIAAGAVGETRVDQFSLPEGSSAVAAGGEEDAGIPGFSAEIIGVISVITVAAIIRKRK